MELNRSDAAIATHRASHGQRGRSLMEVAVAGVASLPQRARRREARSCDQDDMAGRGTPVRTAGAPARIDAALALLAAAALCGAALTAIAATLLSRQVEGDVAELRTAAASRTAAHREIARLAADRPALAAVMERAPVGAVMVALGRSLPAEAQLVSVQRDRDHRLTVEIATNDPDLLAAPFREEPLLRDLVQTQQRSDGRGRLIVSLHAREP